MVRSIQRTCSFLRESAKSSVRELSIFESICCLSAWLSLDDAPEKDFTVGLFKWLAIAARKRPPGEATTGKKYDAAELFCRITMVSKHVQNLYLALQELQKSLRNCAVGKDGTFQNEVFGSFFKVQGTANDILRQTSLKLHSLQQVMPKEFHVKSFPDFPLSKTAETDPSTVERKRKRFSKNQSMVRSKKRKFQRNNRNKVVDIFMNLDQDTNSPRRNSATDAYADLEDFLVEG